VHPGEILQEEFMEPLGLTQYRVAKATGVPARRINEIDHRERAVSADTALRLARLLGTSAGFWMNLPALYDLERARDEVGAEIEEAVAPLAR
jgi:addiction module HigA family antidote